MSQARRRRLKITDCTQVYHGQKDGHSYTIYEVKASQPDGTPIREKLRAFSALAVGAEIEVEITPFNSEKHGRSYTLYPTNIKQQSTNERIEELERQLKQVLAELKDVMGKLRLMEETFHMSQRAVAETEEIDAEMASRLAGDIPF